MKKGIFKGVFPTLLIFALTNCYSQNDTTKQTPPLSRHEIVVNIAPALSLMMGADVRNNRLLFSYKYFLNNESALRASIGMDYRNYGYRFIDSYIGSIWLSNATVTRSPFIRLGYERYFGEIGKLKFIYGADAILGYYKTKSTTPTYYYDSKTGNMDAYCYSQNGFTIGLSPFIGFKYQATKHLGITFQSGYDFTYQYGKSYENNQSMNIRQFNFSKPNGIFSTITLNYKF